MYYGLIEKQFFGCKRLYPIIFLYFYNYLVFTIAAWKQLVMSTAQITCGSQLFNTMNPNIRQLKYLFQSDNSSLHQLSTTKNIFTSKRLIIQYIFKYPFTYSYFAYYYYSIQFALIHSVIVPTAIRGMQFIILPKMYTYPQG